MKKIFIQSYFTTTFSPFDPNNNNIATRSEVKKKKPIFKAIFYPRKQNHPMTMSIEIANKENYQ